MPPSRSKITPCLWLDDQAELDHYWTALAEGGKPGPCGWLKDRFGVSWQVGPAAITEWMASTDTAALKRAFEGR
jgi:predicted 3-demethylubiquinone-9 3-methyltransferase (glyoxalase superfamily)